MEMLSLYVGTRRDFRQYEDLPGMMHTILSLASLGGTVFRHMSILSSSWTALTPIYSDDTKEKMDCDFMFHYFLYAWSTVGTVLYPSRIKVFSFASPSVNTSVSQT